MDQFSHKDRQDDGSAESLAQNETREPVSAEKKAQSIFTKLNAKMTAVVASAAMTLGITGSAPVSAETPKAPSSNVKKEEGKETEQRKMIIKSVEGGRQGPTLFGKPYKLGIHCGNDVLVKYDARKKVPVRAMADGYLFARYISPSGGYVAIMHLLEEGNFNGPVVFSITMHQEIDPALADRTKNLQEFVAQGKDIEHVLKAQFISQGTQTGFVAQRNSTFGGQSDADHVHQQFTFDMDGSIRKRGLLPYGSVQRKDDPSLTWSIDPNAVFNAPNQREFLLAEFNKRAGTKVAGNPR